MMISLHISKRIHWLLFLAIRFNFSLLKFLFNFKPRMSWLDTGRSLVFWSLKLLIMFKEFNSESWFWGDKVPDPMISLKHHAQPLATGNLDIYLLKYYEISFILFSSVAWFPNENYLFIYLFIYSFWFYWDWLVWTLLCIQCIQQPSPELSPNIWIFWVGHTLLNLAIPVFCESNLYTYVKPSSQNAGCRNSFSPQTQQKDL